MKYSIKQVDSKKQLIHKATGENAKIVLYFFFKSFATQEKLKRRVYGISKRNKTFLCFNGRPIHLASFSMSTHNPLSAAECILGSLLPEFKSLRSEFEELLS